MKKMFFVLMSATALFGCYNDKADQLYPVSTTTPCDTANVSYSGTIKPIFDAMCNTSGCHDAAGVGGGYNLSTHAGTMIAVTNGRLSGSINHLSGYNAMPKGLPKLSECEISKIDAWARQGALDN